MINPVTGQPFTLANVDQTICQARTVLNRMLREPDYLHKWRPFELDGIATAAAMLVDQYEGAARRREIRELP